MKELNIYFIFIRSQTATFFILFDYAIKQLFTFLKQIFRFIFQQNLSGPGLLSGPINPVQ